MPKYRSNISEVVVDARENSLDGSWEVTYPNSLRTTYLAEVFQDVFTPVCEPPREEAYNEHAYLVLSSRGEWFHEPSYEEACEHAKDLYPAEIYKLVGVTEVTVKEMV